MYAAMTVANGSDPAETPIDEWETTVRAHRVLKEIGVKNALDLKRVTEADLLLWPTCGRRTLAEIKLFAELCGVALGESADEASRAAFLKKALVARDEGWSWNKRAPSRPFPLGRPWVMARS